MEMAIALCFFFILTTAVFIAIAIFLPEWVGINGEKSAQVRREQQGDAVVEHQGDQPPGATTTPTL